MQVMLDLETLSSDTDAVVIAIGAVEFSSAGLGREFYRTIDPEDAARYGKISGSTVRWWLEQSLEARHEIFTATGRLEFVLLDFYAWLKPIDELPLPGMWGNGVGFDNVILRHAYQATGIRCPWNFTQDRDFRTLMVLRPTQEPRVNVGVAHNALDDAKSQALTAVKALYG